MNAAVSSNLKPLPLAVAIVTLNEEKNLSRCLASVRDLATEIVIIDSGSTDKTAAIAAAAGAIFEVHPWPGFTKQKNRAYQRCSQPWILGLDADEEVSPELAASLRAAFAAGEPAVAGFTVNRRNWYLGAWIWHAWYPEWLLRVTRQGAGQWAGIEPHPALHVTGKTVRLRGDLLHYPFHDLQDQIDRWLRYSHTMADLYASQGRRCRWQDLVLSPWGAFLKRLILKQAWRDGWRGWLIAFTNLFYVFAKYAFLLEKQLATEPKKDS